MRYLLNVDEEIKDEWRISYNGCLDPSHPEVLEYIKEDVRRIGSWGYELIKHDFSTFDLFGKWGFEMNPFVTVDGWHFYDRSKTSAEVVKMLYTAIYEAAKEKNILIIGCNTIGHLGAGLMHITVPVMIQAESTGREPEEWESIPLHSVCLSTAHSMM